MTVAPILFLVLSALIIWLTRNRHSRTQWILASALAFVIWAFILLLEVETAAVFEISVWQPSDLFQSPISLTIDAMNWPLLYGAATVLLAVVLTAPARPASANAGIRSFWFLYTSLALIALMSANLLTTAIAWSMMDLGMLLFLIAISDSVQDRRAIFGRAGVNAVGVFLVIAAAMASQFQGVLALDLNSTSAAGIMMLAIAATFRLGLIPLHFTLPPIAPLRRGVGTLLRLFQPVAALIILARVFEAGLPEVLKIVFLVAGGIGGLLGGIRWVLQKDTVNARPFFVLGLASLGLLIATLSPNGSEVIVSVAVVMLLIGSVLSLFGNHTPTHRLIPIAASAVLLGAPFTPGGVYASSVSAIEFVTSAPLVSLIAVIIASLLALGCFHLLFRAETPWPIGESLARVMFNVGVSLPILVAIGLGSWRLRSEPLQALMFSGAALLIGMLLLLLIRSLSIEQVDRLQKFFGSVRPDFIYSAFWDAVQRFLISLRGLSDLFEGVSGMLWVFVFVIFMLFIIQ